MQWFIVVNGEMHDLAWHRRLLTGDGQDAFAPAGVVCADGGANHLYRLGIIPELVVGDLDSVAPEAAAWLDKHRVRVIRAPKEKDETDTRLALEWVIANHPEVRQVTLLGAFGGRLDHALANLQLMLTGWKKGIKIKLADEAQEIFLITPEWAGEFKGLGACISLLAGTPEVLGVTTQGMQYPLSGARITFDKPIGISNILNAESARVTVEAGVLLAVVNR